MINISLIFLVIILLLTIVQVTLLIYKRDLTNTKDEYIIDLSTLERIIDDYVNTILIKKIQQTKKDYNLDPGSRINSILSFEKKVNGLISESTIEIVKMLTPTVAKNLSKRFSNRSLALLIIYKIKQTLV